MKPIGWTLALGAIVLAVSGALAGEVVVDNSTEIEREVCSIHDFTWRYDDAQSDSAAELGHLYFSELLAPGDPVDSNAPTHIGNWRLLLTTGIQESGLQIWRMTRGSPKQIVVANADRSGARTFIPGTGDPSVRTWFDSSRAEQATRSMTILAAPNCAALIQISPDYCSASGLGTPECN